NDVGHLVVQRLSRGHQLANAGLRIFGLQEGAVAVARNTTIQFFGGGAQVDHHTPCLQVRTVLGREDGPAAGGQHDARHRRTFFEHVAFAPTEPFFTFDVKDMGNAYPATRFDLVIEVAEFAAQHAGQCATYGGFACPHHTHQEHGNLIGQFDCLYAALVIGVVSG